MCITFLKGLCLFGYVIHLKHSVILSQPTHIVQYSQSVVCRCWVIQWYNQNCEFSMILNFHHPLPTCTHLLHSRSNWRPSCKAFTAQVKWCDNRTCVLWSRHHQWLLQCIRREHTLLLLKIPVSHWLWAPWLYWGWRRLFLRAFLWLGRWVGTTGQTAPATGGEKRLCTTAGTINLMAPVCTPVVTLLQNSLKCTQLFRCKIAELHYPKMYDK